MCADREPSLCERRAELRDAVHDGSADDDLLAANDDLLPERAAGRSQLLEATQDWAKMGGSAYKGSDGLQFETHWYEKVRTGERIEFKTKVTGGSP